MIKFSRENGWNEDRLFQLAKRHLVAAEVLFENQDKNKYILSVSSAGYLCHLGIELVLKSCWLYETGYFQSEHNLHKLVKMINFLNLKNNLNVYLSNIELFNEMRYPQDLSNVCIPSLLDHRFH